MNFDKFIAVDLETSGLIEKGKIPEIICYSWCDVNRPGVNVDLEYLHDLLKDKIPVFHNAKFDLPILRYYGFDIKKYHDTMLMSYTLDTSAEHSLEACGQSIGLKKEQYDFKKEGFEYTKKLAVYAEKDALITWNLFKEFYERILYSVDYGTIYELELAFSECIIEYEATGLPVDTAATKEYEFKLNEIIWAAKEKLKKTCPKVPAKNLKIYRSEHPELKQYLVEFSEGRFEFERVPRITRTGEIKKTKKGTVQYRDKKVWVERPEWKYQLEEDFNYNSRRHKAYLLQQQGWQPTNFAKDEVPVMGETTITRILGQCPSAQTILDITKASKTLNTFIKALLQNQDDNGFVHGNVNQTVTRTGRLSSCVAEWTRVKTKRGLVQIKDLIPGDEVWTHKRRWQPVLGLQVKPDDTMVDVTFCNGYVLTCTLYHKLNVPGIGWKTVKEIIDEHIQSVDFEPAEHRKLFSSLQSERQNLFDASYSREFKYYLSQHKLCNQNSCKSRRNSFAEKNSIFAIKDGRQKSHERQNRSSTSQLERGMCGWLWLRDDYTQRKKTICSPRNIGSSAWNRGNTKMASCSPHRWEQIEQRHRQFSLVHNYRAQQNTQFTSDGLFGQIKEINYRGTLPVWDIYVAEDHSYWSESCFSHNSKPNLQNLPSRGETGDKIRSLIKAPDDHVIIGVDLSNIEARILAYYLEKICHDSYLADVFRSGKDLHDMNAAAWGLDRDMAKKVLYLTSYGGGAEKLAISANIPLQIAESIVAKFFAAMPSIENLKYACYQYVKQKGFIRTILHRHVHYKLVDSLDHEHKSRVQRQSFNALLQGSAADIIKKLSVQTYPLHAMCDVQAMIQNHDENLWLAKNDERVQKFINKATPIWNESKLLGTIPIVAEFKVGKTWYQVH